MLSSSRIERRTMRVYYNLPSKSDHGRKMTGHITPYRHWMWKQNELWRNVHEAQFEHLRKVYKRQWLESFRVNADEYIFKYNITKAAQLAQWEHEMQGQEKKRIDALHMARGRQSLRKKHMDLLREYHERQFFYWYERASERLQYMNHIKYVSQDSIQSHIEKELDKYVGGKQEAYPLNFVGQMPLLEDSDGNVIEVPENLMANHAAENHESKATVYNPPAASAMMEDKLLHMMVSGHEEELDWLKEADSQAIASTITDLDREAEEDEEAARVPLSMEETEDERQVSRRAYIDRGKTGSRAIFRRPRADGEGETSATPSTGDGSDSPQSKGRRRILADTVKKQDKALLEMSQKNLVGGAKPGMRIRERVVVPTSEQIMSNPIMRAANESPSRIRTQDVTDRYLERGKYKKNRATGVGGGSNSGNEDV